MNLKPEDKKKLELLLANELLGPAQAYIDKNKLPFQIVDGKLKAMQSPGEVWLDQFITCDVETIKLKEDCLAASRSDYEVLIVGETGTGKEILARSMIGERTGPIKSVNCAGLPSELIESELFGYVKGAFTGATKDKEGLMLSAAQGLMFLDEIGDLDFNMQAKLLRVLQDRKVRRVGSNTEEDLTCRFVFATNKNIRQLVEQDKFRKDLYARISKLEIDIKPLRERVCDVIPIAKSMKDGQRLIDYLQQQDAWKQLDLSLNVRGLEKAIARLAVWGRIT